MKIAIIHMGSLSQILPASSILRGIKRHVPDSDITWVVGAESLCYIYKYTKDVSRVFTVEQFIKTPELYDMVINLDPFFPMNLSCNFESKTAIGFGFCQDLDVFKEVFTGEKHIPEMNWFQLYFKLSRMVWMGEGYDLSYFPKTKCHKNQVGISVANSNLRNYVLDNLDLKNMKIWYIPYRKNLFKKMDEINRCSKIITDDLTTLHVSLSLRKYVYFLETSSPVLRPELFSSGEIHKVPLSVFQ